ncbi:MAG: leucine-rich repeat protein [Treponema sp.]|nr:leucine-rich repeat protein [Treponema sp.]
MPKCKVCGFRLNDGVTKCPMCGAMAGSTVAGEVSQNLNLQKYACPVCKEQIIGEHRYCPSCGADLKNAAESVQENVTASGLKETPMEAFKYEVVDGKYILIRLKDTSLTEVVIPRIFSEIGGCIEKAQFDHHMGIWKIAKEGSEQMLGAFCGCENLTSIIIPNTIAKIGDGAFCCCTKLTNLVIPNSVTEIGIETFRWCTSLKNIIIP